MLERDSRVRRVMVNLDCVRSEDSVSSLAMSLQSEIIGCLIAYVQVT